jgi:hypothetical protein
MIWIITNSPALFPPPFNKKCKRHSEVSSALNGALIGKLVLIMLHFHKECYVGNMEPPFSVCASS